MAKLLTEADFTRAAQELDCEVACIKAVAKVESSKSGFLSTGEPVILFEAHHFSRLTKRAYDKSHPKISSSKWNRSLYEGGINEHHRLGEAVKLNRDAALQSASWGKFQIMGFNHLACGFDSIQTFINAMYESEGKQLDAFVGFIQSQGLAKALKDKQWAKFARGYNGASYAKNKYDTKLAQAYESYSA